MNDFVKIDTRGLSAAYARLRGLAEKQIKAATIAAVNAGAAAGRLAVQDEMGRVFDRPTPWVRNAVRYIKAGKAGSSVRNPGVFDMRGQPAFEKLGADRTTAIIDLTPDGNKHGVVVADQVLAAQMRGGPRRHKRSEEALRAVGVLPPGTFIVPGPGARRDRYGNMESAQIVQIISWFQGFERWAGARQNMTDKRKMQLMKGVKKKGVRQRGFELFVLHRQTGKLPPGIYMRKDYSAGEHKRMAHLSHGGATALMYFVKSTSYRKRLDFYGVGGRAAMDQMRRSFHEYLGQMLRERGL